MMPHQSLGDLALNFGSLGRAPKISKVMNSSTEELRVSYAAALPMEIRAKCLIDGVEYSLYKYLP